MNLPLSILVAVLSGMLTWSFSEYCIHRFVGHACKGRNRFSREHLAHHSNPDYFAPTWQKMIFGSAYASLCFSLSLFFLPVFVALIYALSFALSYGFYEWLHRRIHTHAPRNAYGKMMRKHHLSHHFSDARQCHGVSSRVWDRVFGTHRSVQQVRVPRKLATAWMLTPEGQLHENLSQSYVLVGRQRG